jgi:hypothetical protein
LKEYKNVSRNTNRKHYNCGSNTKIPFFIQNLSRCIFQRSLKSIGIRSFMQLSEIIFLNDNKILLWLGLNKVVIIILSKNFIDRCLLRHLVFLNCERKIRLGVPALANILVVI